MSMNQLTVGDIAEIETISDLPFAALGDASVPKGKLLQAVAYVLKRKTNPTFTMEDAGKLSMEEMNALLDENPTKKD
jgi:hypothetical protein